MTCPCDDIKLKMPGCEAGTPPVIEIKSSEAPVLFHTVTIPASVGTVETLPPTPGAYRNARVTYEADEVSYLYDSDGIPQLLSNGGSTAEASSTASAGVAIGNASKVSDTAGVAIGNGAKCEYKYSVGLGGISKPRAQGVVDIAIHSAYSILGYQGVNDQTRTNLRVISGVHDGEQLNDAATVAQGNTLATSAPTTTTAGVLGQLYTDTTAMHTYQCTAIDTTDPDNPSYTWTQRW